MSARRFLFLLLVLIMPGLSLHADETVVVQRLRSLLAMELPQRDTVIACPGRLPEGISLRVTHDEASGEVTALGISLFAPELSEVLSPRLCQSTERVLLNLLLLPDDKERERWLKGWGIRLFAGTQRFGTPRFRHIDRILPVLRQPDQLEILDEEERIKVLLGQAGTGEEIRLSLPKNRELICGTDKKEADERMALTLQQWTAPVVAAAVPALEETLPDGDSGLRRLAGEAMQFPSMCTDAYYEMESDTTDASPRLRPVLDMAHPTQTVRNLLLGRVVPDSLLVSIEHHQYGGKTRCWQQPWAQMMGAMSQHGSMRLYASCRPEPQQGNYTGILLALDELTASAHMMLVNVPVNWPTSGVATELDAMLFTNIPLSNVKSFLR